MHEHASIHVTPAVTLSYVCTADTIYRLFSSGTGLGAENSDCHYTISAVKALMMTAHNSKRRCVAAPLAAVHSSEAPGNSPS